MAVPAEPILASSLWTAPHEAPAGGSNIRDFQVRSGSASIDKAFGAALQYGRISCISTEPQSGGRDLGHAYTASHLLSNPQSKATVIDTALSFDVRKFYRLLLSHLVGQADAEEVAVEALDRLQIMKVFDFEGLTDSMLELRRALEGAPPTTETSEEVQAAPMGTIGDSEDEDEMLDSPSPPPPEKKNTAQQAGNGSNEPSKHLLLVDSISHVATPVIRSRYAEGQALLISFMRSLRHLSISHQLMTILMNDAIPRANIKDETPSIFASCTLRPALGRSFEHMIDTHLLIHCAGSVPKGKESGSATGNEEAVSVVEVMHDAHGSAFGRWAAFTVNETSELKDAR